MILKTDGSLWACGWNYDGQLGDGTTTNRSTPVQVMTGVAAVSAGGSHTMILKTDGSLWACGDNYYGQLCDGTNVGRHIPVQIAEPDKSSTLPKHSDIVLSSAGYATFFSSESAYTLPNGLSAHVVTGLSNDKLTTKTIADGSVAGVVPKGTAVMLMSDNKQAGTYTLTATENATTYSGTNLLRGSDEATTTTGSGYHYKLTYGASNSSLSNVFGWYWGAQNGAPFKIEGNRAWLVVPKSGTRAGGFAVDGNALDTSGMMPESAEEEERVYDLQGRRVKNPTQKGLYIKNGKVIVN